MASDAMAHSNAIRQTAATLAAAYFVPGERPTTNVLWEYYLYFLNRLPGGDRMPEIVEPGKGEPVR